MTPGPGGQFDHLLKNIKSRVETSESREKTEESRVETPESAVQPIEEAKGKSRVESKESRVKAGESEAKSPEKIRKESRVKKAAKGSPESRVDKEESGVDKKESRVESLDYSALDEAIEEAIKKPKLGVYSPVVAAMLRYKAITTPRYSMGSEIKAIVEQALKDAYPELYEEVQKRMNTRV